MLSVQTRLASEGDGAKSFSAERVSDFLESVDRRDAVSTISRQLPNAGVTRIHSHDSKVRIVAPWTAPLHC